MPVPDEESYVRWEPLPGLPERPLSKMQVNYDGNILVATAIYAGVPPAGVLRIAFEIVQAFKAYEEFSDPWMEARPSQPMIRDTALTRWAWPFQRVTGSRWVERVLRRNGGIESWEWRHYVIVTSDMTLHVMTTEDPSLELLPSA